MFILTLSLHFHGRKSPFSLSVWLPQKFKLCVRFRRFSSFSLESGETCVSATKVFKLSVIFLATTSVRLSNRAISFSSGWQTFRERPVYNFRNISLLFRGILHIWMGEKLWIYAHDKHNLKTSLFFRRTKRGSKLWADGADVSSVQSPRNPVELDTSRPGSHRQMSSGICRNGQVHMHTGWLLGAVAGHAGLQEPSGTKLHDDLCQKKILHGKF